MFDQDSIFFSSTLPLQHSPLFLSPIHFHNYYPDQFNAIPLWFSQFEAMGRATDWSNPLKAAKHFFGKHFNLEKDADKRLLYQFMNTDWENEISVNAAFREYIKWKVMKNEFNIKTLFHVQKGQMSPTYYSFVQMASNVHLLKNPEDIPELFFGEFFYPDSIAYDHFLYQSFSREDWSDPAVFDRLYPLWMEWNYVAHCRRTSLDVLITRGNQAILFSKIVVYASSLLYFSLNFFRTPATQLWVCVTVDQGNVFETARSVIMNASVKQLQESQWYAKFNNESGVDAGGLRKEVISQFVEETMQRNLFELDDSTGMYYFSKSSSIEDYEYVGRMLGMSINLNIPWGILFKDALFQWLVKKDKEWTLLDMADFDPIIYRTLERMDEENGFFQMTFEDDEGNALSKKYDPTDPVTRENLEEFKKLRVQWDISSRYLSKYNSFRKGLSDTLKEPLEKTSWDVLKSQIVGSHRFNVEDWIYHIQWSNLEESNVVLRETFVEILRCWEREDPKKLSQLLKFVTGLRVPPFPGFVTLDPPFNVNIVNGTQGSLMSAHTCSNTLDISNNTKLEWMEEKLYESMHQMEFHLFK